MAADIKNEDTFELISYVKAVHRIYDDAEKHPTRAAVEEAYGLLLWEKEMILNEYPQLKNSVEPVHASACGNLIDLVDDRDIHLLIGCDPVAEYYSPYVRVFRDAAAKEAADIPEEA